MGAFEESLVNWQCIYGFPMARFKALANPDTACFLGDICCDNQASKKGLPSELPVAGLLSLPISHLHAPGCEYINGVLLPTGPLP